MKHFRLVPALLLALSSVAASDQPHVGSTWKDARVTDLTVYPSGGSGGKGYVVVTYSSNGTGTPSCASGYPRDLVIDLSTPGGAFAGSAAQMSLMSGAVMTVTGTGTCGVIPTAETLASIQQTTGMR
jgi:hypothetical protein